MLCGCSKNKTYYHGEIFVKDGIKYQYLEPEVSEGYISNIPTFRSLGQDNYAYHSTYYFDMTDDEYWEGNYYANTPEYSRFFEIGDRGNLKYYHYHVDPAQYINYGTHLYLNRFATMPYYHDLYTIARFDNYSRFNTFIEPSLFIVDVDENMTKIDVPDEIDGYKVNGIGEGCFNKIDHDIEINIIRKEDAENYFFIMPFAFQGNDETRVTINSNKSVFFFSAACNNIQLALNVVGIGALDAAFNSCNIVKLDQYNKPDRRPTYMNCYGIYGYYEDLQHFYNIIQFPFGLPVIKPIFYNTKFDLEEDSIYIDDESDFYSYPQYLHYINGNIYVPQRIYSNNLYGIKGYMTFALLSNNPSNKLFIDYNLLSNYINDRISDKDYEEGYLVTFVHDNNLYKDDASVLFRTNDNYNLVDKVNKTSLYITIAGYYGLNRENHEFIEHERSYEVIEDVNKINLNMANDLNDVISFLNS